MAKYTVFFKVHATAVVSVEAETEEEAQQIASNEYEGASISICHQCSKELSDPTYGEVVEACLVEGD